MKPDSILQIINQLHLLESKINKQPEAGSGTRQIDRIKRIFESEGYIIENPEGELYDPMRTDIDANLMSSQTTLLRINEVVKPVVYFRQSGDNRLLQKGVVMVG